MKANPNSSSHENPLSIAPDDGDRALVLAERAQTEKLVEARSRQILKAIVAFRDGDFSARLPADWPGILCSPFLPSVPPRLPNGRSREPAQTQSVS